MHYAFTLLILLATGMLALIFQIRFAERKLKNNDPENNLNRPEGSPWGKAPVPVKQPGHLAQKPTAMETTNHT